MDDNIKSAGTIMRITGVGGTFDNVIKVVGCEGHCGADDIVLWFGLEYLALHKNL